MLTHEMSAKELDAEFARVASLRKKAEGTARLHLDILLEDIEYFLEEKYNQSLNQDFLEKESLFN